MSITASTIHSLFRIIVAKKLTAVDAEPDRSNGHEIGGLSALEPVLRGKQIIYGVKYLFIGLDDEVISADGWATWYDARKQNPDRNPEWHMYYQNTPVTNRMSEGDFLLVGIMNDEGLLFLVVAKDSGLESNVMQLFGITKFRERGFTDVDLTSLTNIPGFMERSILGTIGIEYEYWNDSFLDQLLALADGRFPGTAEFAEFTRTTLKDEINPSLPDETLIILMDREELLFRTLEKHIVEERIECGFSGVDYFISFSLSVQNRRKSRAGHAFENHLAAIFSLSGLKFEQGAHTEGRSNPDFIFPSAKDYSDVNFPLDKLFMLGAKTSCKDRWRQVLAEAARLKTKHLITLECGISSEQTDEMQRNALQLIIPSPLHSSYSQKQRNWICSLQEFIEMVATSQTS